MEPKTIGERIAACRQWRRMTQDDLAAECHITQSAVAKIETRDPLYPRGLERIAKVLNVRVEYLLFGIVGHEVGFEEYKRLRSGGYVQRRKM